MSDNLRWDALNLRAGDIVISTPPKSGTTWTQRLVSLLIFDGPDLPAPLPTLSPWLDLTAQPIDDVVASLDVQHNRRFIKTHTPLDGLLLDERVTYIVVGRDPRDAAVSMMLDLDKTYALQEFTAGPGHPFPPPGPPPGAHSRGTHPPHGPPPRRRSPLDEMRDWLERPVAATEGVVSLASILHHFDTFWSRRHLPNVAGFHYADYQTDLIDELVRLAEVLGVNVTRYRAEQLAKHASLGAMRDNADELSPDLWDSHESVFRCGGVREWREIFTDTEHLRYQQRTAALAAPHVRAWAHVGRRGADPTSAEITSAGG
ncbi:MAG: sulfotransferase domain-containing protein [Mycobacterium sp.]